MKFTWIANLPNDCTLYKLVSITSFIGPHQEKHENPKKLKHDEIVCLFVLFFFFSVVRDCQKMPELYNICAGVSW